MPSSIDSDAASLARWWVDHAASVTDGVRGLWFGLADLVGDDGAVRHCMYVAGTPDLAAADGDDWACEYLWEPSDRYLQLDGLAAINLNDWVGAVEHALAVVSAVRPWETGPRDLRGVGVGFDDGDVNIVWTSPSVDVPVIE